MSELSSKPSAGSGHSCRTLVFGCGYLGRRVAENAVFLGQKVWASTRNPDKAADLASRGIDPLIIDWTDRKTLSLLPDVDRVLVAVSYDRHSDQSRYDCQVGGLRNLLDFVSEKAHICYISTTGVYHQQDGSWVDEDTPTLPERDGGKVHLQAERLLNDLRPSAPWTILRLAGIYGPGRVPRARDLIAGRPVAASAGSFLNLIHVDDAADVVMSAWSQAAHRLYLVCDDHPVLRGDFYGEVARLSSVPAPEFVEPAENDPARVRFGSNKRVRNHRMKRDLVAELRYPSYREGLPDVLEA